MWQSEILNFKSESNMFTLDQNLSFSAKNHIRTKQIKGHKCWYTGSKEFYKEQHRAVSFNCNLNYSSVAN